MTKTFNLEYTKTESLLKYEGAPAETGVVIVAAGSASRMGGLNKITAELLGVPVIIRTLRTFDNLPQVKSIVVVTRQDMILDLQKLISDFEISKVTDIINGGASRAGSVKNGFEVLEKDKAIKNVLIHDGARPLISEKVIINVLTATQEFSAAIPVVPLKDTVKRIGALGRVEETLDRSSLVSVQTPQGFSMGCYRKALDDANENEGIDKFTDDSALVENAGFKVYTVEGDYKNIKITTPEDMSVAMALIGKESGVL